MSTRSLVGKNVLILGGAGFIGSHLVDEIRKKEVASVLVVDNFFLGKIANLSEASSRQSGPSLNVERIDAANLAALQALVEKYEVDWIFNLAVVPLAASIDSPDYAFMTNVQITSNCCELARIGKIEHLVHLSSSEVYGTASYVPMDESHPFNPSTPYAASKLASDQLVQAFQKTFGISANIFRPFNNFGPRQNSGSFAGIIPSIVSSVQLGLPIEVSGDGSQTRDFVFVRETAELIVMASQSISEETGPVNIASGLEVSINELVRLCLSLLGAKDHPIVYGTARPGDVNRHLGDSTLLKELLKKSPLGLTEGFLRETVKWYEQDLKND